MPAEEKPNVPNAEEILKNAQALLAKITELAETAKGAAAAIGTTRDTAVESQNVIATVLNDAKTKLTEITTVATQATAATGTTRDAVAESQKLIDSVISEAKTKLTEITVAATQAATAAGTSRDAAAESQKLTVAALTDAKAKLDEITIAATQVVAAKTRVTDDQAVIATKSDHIEDAQKHADTVRADLPTCSIVTSSSHGWPVTFYQNTVTGNTQPGYNGFGFPLSEEGGNWNYATNHYPVGNIASVNNLGTAPPACEKLQPTIPGTLVVKMDFTSSLEAWVSPTGTILPNSSAFTAKSGSPAWVGFIVPNTNAVNTVDFDADFTSGSGAAGLLTVYWDANVIGSIDEAMVGPGLEHYTLPFAVTTSNSVHVIGFRLDPFTNIQSVVTVTNVILGEIGVSQPFSLTVTTNKINGSPVYQLVGEAGFDYGLQMSTNLLDWTQIGVLQNTNGVVNFADPGSSNSPYRFYRVVAPY